MTRILGSIEHERIIGGLELKVVRLILENRELRRQIDALTTANMKLRHAAAGVLDDKDQSTKDD